MKILSIVSSGYEQGGAEASIVSYNEAFRTMGHEVRTIASDSRPDIPHFSDYEFQAIPTTGIKSFIYTFFNPSAYTITKKVLLDFQPDVVLLHTMQQVTPSVLWTLRRYPTIQCVHGPEAFTTSLLPWHMSRANFKNGEYDLRNLTLGGKLHYLLLRYVYVPTYKLGFRNIAKFLVFSSYSRDLLQQDGFTMKPIAVIPIGMKLPYAMDGVKKEAHTIVYVGRLEKFKGVMDLVNAMPAVLQAIPDARLELAGDGACLPELKARVQELGLRKVVILKGHISQKSVAQLVARASVVVMPSTWPETFGKVGIEAMGLGTPVVASDVGGVRDWLHDKKNGLLVEPGKTDQLSRAIVRVLSDSKLQSQMSENARQSAADFTAEKFADNLLQVIRETVAI